MVGSLNDGEFLSPKSVVEMREGEEVVLLLRQGGPHRGIRLFSVAAMSGLVIGQAIPEAAMLLFLVAGVSLAVFERVVGSLEIRANLDRVYVKGRIGLLGRMGRFESSLAEFSCAPGSRSTGDLLMRCGAATARFPAVWARESDLRRISRIITELRRRAPHAQRS